MELLHLNYVEIPGMVPMRFFIPDGQSKTWGEMGAEEQVTYLLRRIGLEKLEKLLAFLGSVLCITATLQQ